MSVSIKVAKRASSDGENVTIFMTLTSTYTVLSGQSTESTATKRSSSKSSSTAAVSQKMVTETSDSISLAMVTESSDSTSLAEASDGTTLTIKKPTSTFHMNSNLVVNSTGTSEPVPVGTFARTNVSEQTKLGLAVGIPIAVVSLFSLIALAWYFIKRHKTSAKQEKMVNYKDDFFSLSNHNKKQPYEDVSSEQTITSQWFSRNPDNFERLRSVNASKPSLFNRLSRLIYHNSSEYDVRAAPPVPNFPHGADADNPSLKTPVFLRKFNLHNSPKIQPSPAKTRVQGLQSTPVPSNSTGLSKRKDLPRLPPLISTYKASNSLPGMENAVVAPPPRSKLDPRKQMKPSHVVIHDYVRQLGDELTVAIGDQVRLLAPPMSDGWCLVKLITMVDAAKSRTDNGGLSEGMIPLRCIKQLS